MVLSEIIWKTRFADKMAGKQHVSIWEVEEVLTEKAFVVRIARGRVKGEDVYEAFGQTHAGRYLVVFFIRKGTAALPISARNMTASERRYYAKNS